jgi:hypothetical protein
MAGLFDKANGQRKRTRQIQRLFVPSVLRNEADHHFLKADGKLKRAQDILQRWASLEASGQIFQRSETSLEGEFINQVFVEALGYTPFSEGLGKWNLNPRYRLPDGQEADAALGLFVHAEFRKPRAVIELKGPSVDLDRHRFNGRTPVQQCFDYLNAEPECPWGIVSNYVSFRLYHRSRGTQAYEQFLLEDLVEPRVFRDFYTLFERDGLLPVIGVQKARADRLLEYVSQRQREVGDELYRHYRQQRADLIQELQGEPHRKSLEDAIRIAQKIIDRVVFIAFCEDRGLLPEDVIGKAWREQPPFQKVTNPRWRNFVHLFRCVDEGDEDAGIPEYDGTLFEKDPEVDDLDLVGDARTGFFKDLGSYDFSAEVNLDVLGHLFENSISDLDEIRRAGLKAYKPGEEPKMMKSARRKRTGVYYTPMVLTEFITRNTLLPVLQKKLQDVLGDVEAAFRAPAEEASAEKWRACHDVLREVKVCDPACGSGAFLIQAYRVLEEQYDRVLDALAAHALDEAEDLREEVPDRILANNLYGVDLSGEAVEITRLALWLASARPGKKLTDLTENVVQGNSLVDDPEVDGLALNWHARFAEVFARGAAGFDCVIGNPPWERMKLQEREWFDTSRPDIASAVSAATRRKLISELEQKDPELHARYVAARDEAERTLAYTRACGHYPLTGKGDINTYAAFAELARLIVAPAGRVGLLVPSGIATDLGTKDFFQKVLEERSLIALFDFENKAPFFPDVHRSFKFSVFLFGGEGVNVETPEFVFFAREMEDIEDRKRRIPLSAKDFRLLNPNTRTCPIFRTRRDADLTRRVYRRVRILVDKSRKRAQNPWQVKFLRMYDQTNNADLFRMAEELNAEGFRLDGNRWIKGKRLFLPLYEAKMVQAYDHRAASVVVADNNWMRQGQTEPTSLVQHQNPEFAPLPRFWVEQSAVATALGDRQAPAYLAYKDVTSPTNQRTMIAAMVPHAAFVNSAPLILPEATASARDVCCLLANLNSFVYDFVARQKVGGIHLNFFIVEQLPTFPPETYGQRCPWDRRTTLEKWISDRVLKLSCTSDDMRPLAKAAGLSPAVHPWDPDERAQLLAELDAAYFLLYGVKREDAEYILSTFVIAGTSSADLLSPVSIGARVLEQYDALAAKS